MKIARFELEDCEATSHTYEVELFSCDENARLQLMCATPLLRAVGRLIGAITPALGEDGLQGAMGSMDGMIQALGKMDWTEVPEALAAIPEEIEKRGGPALVAEIFARTTRLTPVPELQSLPSVDDRKIETDLRQRLKLAGDRDLAFGDGNFAEYWAAVGMVLAVNFTRIGRSGSATWRDALRTLTGGLLTQSSLTTETPGPRIAS